MASTARATVRRRLGGLIAGAVVVTAVSVATAGASARMGAKRLGWPGWAPAPARAAAPAPQPPES
jgi:hypothetical protein